MLHIPSYSSFLIFLLFSRSIRTFLQFSRYIKYSIATSCIDSIFSRIIHEVAESFLFFSIDWICFHEKRRASLRVSRYDKHSPSKAVALRGWYCSNVVESHRFNQRVKIIDERGGLVAFGAKLKGGGSRSRVFVPLMELIIIETP